MSRRLPTRSRATIAVANPGPLTSPIWRAAQGLGLATTGVILAGLLLNPNASLPLFWNVAIPLLPAIFLLNPVIWRNVCPLASMNRFVADRWDNGPPTEAWVRWAPVVGIGLLYVLVPARRFLFNGGGGALVLLIGVVALLALGLGLFYEGKSGFCNGICPVLSVERLYGQQPLADVTNARCAPCTRCTGTGCIDLTSEKSIAQTLGSARKSPRWLLTPFGLFAASFPGFVFGYFTISNGPIHTAPRVYAHVLLWAAASLAATTVVTLRFPKHNRRILLLLGAVAATIYYWFAIPTLIATLSGPETLVLALRSGALVLVLAWVARGWRVRWGVGAAV